MGRLNDTYTDRNWAEDPPSDSSQNASRQQLYTKQTQNTSSQSLCAVSFIFHMEFPSDVLFSWLSCWGGSNPWNYRPVSFLPSLCHSGVATVINVVREPQGALTLQPYLWLASWNEHSPHCTCTQTYTHTHTHTPVSRGLKKPCRTCLSGNWTLRTTWKQTVAAGCSESACFYISYNHLKKQNKTGLWFCSLWDIFVSSPSSVPLSEI